MSPQELVARWEHAVSIRKQWEAYEIECRRDLFNAAFPSPVTGMNRRQLPDGRWLEAITGYNIKLDNKDDKVDAVSQHIGKHAPLVFSWKPSLLLSGYKVLPHEHKKMVDDLIVATPKMPDLKIAS